MIGTRLKVDTFGIKILIKNSTQRLALVGFSFKKNHGYGHLKDMKTMNTDLKFISPMKLEMVSGPNQRAISYDIYIKLCILSSFLN